MINIHTIPEVAEAWLEQYRGKKPIFACILGFTATGLIPGISAAGATPQDRLYTAVADAEFLVHGPGNRRYPLPPLEQGASPVLISRAVLTDLAIPIYIFDAGLRVEPSIPTISLQGKPANCLSTGKAMDLATVNRLWHHGLTWGEKLGRQAQGSYLIIGECVVGGTTTALALLMGLGINAMGKVNSSHPHCNHQQKLELVQQGLKRANYPQDPFELVAAVGDPMQISAAAMAIAASSHAGVLLAGGTQMLAVHHLLSLLVPQSDLAQILVGTTRWVAEDPTGDTIGLAQLLYPVPLISTQLSFAEASYPTLAAYEQGYVKEGVGAGGCAIAAHLYQGWQQDQLLRAVEQLASYSQQLKIDSHS